VLMVGAESRKSHSSGVFLAKKDPQRPKGNWEIVNNGWTNEGETPLSIRARPSSNGIGGVRLTLDSRAQHISQSDGQKTNR